MLRATLGLALLAFASLTVLATAHEQDSAAHHPDGVVTPNLSHVIPNIPGKSLVAVEVTYPPGGETRPHHHARSAFIYGYVVSGSIRSQVKGHPEKIYKAGQSFTESPGDYHVVSGNASTTEPAKLLAVFIVDTKDQELTVLDK
ncbi:MAG: cupin domain-containing protein [Proteobacteria bacterium]|nr:cupin domain-containing protein [Pseudomonadota bacterium]